jgi:putative RecB family exonuclease
MDRVDGDGQRQRIVDYKTGKAFDQDKADKSLQLGIYALAARALWGAASRDLVIYNLEDNSETVSQRSAGELGELECKVREISAAIRESVNEGYFEAKPGFQCRWCDFRTVCPAREQRLYNIQRAVAAN